MAAVNRSNAPQHVIDSWVEGEQNTQFTTPAELQQHRRRHQRISERVSCSYESPVPPGVGAALVLCITILAIVCAVVMLVTAPPGSQP